MHRFAWNTISVGVDPVEQWIRPILYGVQSVWNVQPTLLVGDRQSFQIRLRALPSEVYRGRCDISDAIAIFGQVLVESALEFAGRGDVIGINVQTLVPLVATLQDQV